MKEDELEELKVVKGFHDKLMAKISIYLGVALILIGLLSSVVQRVSLTLLKIKCINASGVTTQPEKGKAFKITQKMIENSLNNKPIEDSRFAEGYLPRYFLEDHYPLFTTNYSVSRPLLLTNFFKSGDIGFVKKGSDSDSLEVEIYRHSFDYVSSGNINLKFSTDQIDSNKNFNILFFPEKYAIINNCDTIKLYSLKQMNKAFKDYLKKEEIEI